MKAAYKSRRKLRVQNRWVTDETQVGGAVVVQQPPYTNQLQWVYTREDGTEFANLKSQEPVRKDALGWYVERRCTAIPSVDIYAALGLPRPVSP